MARMKSRAAFPPLGWTFTQPQVSYETEYPERKSFDVVVNEVINVRRANPFAAQQNGWALDYDTVADEVDAFNAQRCVARGWTNFVEDATGPPMWSPQRRRPNVAGVVGAIKNTAAGIKVVTEWLGSGLRPVDKSLAESRAAVCVDCPQNQDPNFLQKLETAAAEEIKHLVGIRNDLNLSTQHDAKLNMCQVCQCVMSLKVWVPKKHIAENTSETIRAQLAAVTTNTGQKCWVTTELEDNRTSV